MAGYNYGYNRKKLEVEFSQMAEICRKAKISEENIEEIHRLLLNQLNSDRQYYTHTISYDSLKFSAGDASGIEQTQLLKNFLDRFTTTPIDINNWEKMAWVEDLDSEEILAWIRALKTQYIKR